MQENKDLIFEVAEDALLVANDGRPGWRGTAPALSWPDRQLFLAASLTISQSDRSIDPM